MSVSKEYEQAIMAFQQHVHQRDDGYFWLDVEDGQDIGIADPVIFGDLKRSLDETNRKIKLGQIDPKVIRPYAA